MPVNRVRVLQIISGFAVEGPLGGIERFGIELSRNLNSSQIDNTLVGLWSYGQPTESRWITSVTEHGSQAWMGPQFDFDKPYQSFIHCYRQFMSEFGEQRFDVIHSHCQFGDLLALLITPRLGAKAKFRTVHNEREWGRRPVRRMLLTNLLYPLLFDAEIGVSQCVVDNLNTRRAAHLFRKRAQRIYNAVNLSRFTKPDHVTSIRARYGIPDDAFLVGSIGRLTEQKGYADLLIAARIVVAQHSDVYFMIVGEGELHGQLTQQIRDTGLTERVILTGALENIETILWGWDLFVSSSLWEGLPTVILESMAAGVPVVATQVSGTVELIEHQQNGLLVSPGDTREIADAITKLKKDSGLAKELSQRAEQSVVRFSVVNIAKQYENLYKTLTIPR